MARSKKELSGKMRKRMVQIILAALAAGTLAVTVPTALPGSRAEAASVQLAGGTTVDAVAVAGIVADGCTGTLLVLDTEIGTFRIVLDTNTQYGTTQYLNKGAIILTDIYAGTDNQFHAADIQINTDNAKKTGSVAVGTSVAKAAAGSTTSSGTTVKVQQQTTRVSGVVDDATTTDLLVLKTKDGTMKITLYASTDMSDGKVLIPGGTYVLYDDGAEVILTATRDGLSKDSDNAKDWNDGQPTEASDRQAVSYRALFIAGPSEKGKALQDKVNAGEELTWEDLDGANWSVMGTSSPAGYIYPALWLQDHYGKGISDLSSAVQSDSYASAFARLASGQVDVLVTYADARRDYAERWNSEFGREGSIWEETGVIGVTAPIYNDTISVSKNSDIMDADLITALQQAFINIGNTDAGKQVIAIYSHNGYQIAQSSDYDNERAAQKLIQELTAAN